MTKRADRFVVGFVGKGERAYGKECQGISTMTRRQAKERIKSLPSCDIYCAVYELVEVERTE